MFWNRNEEDNDEEAKESYRQLRNSNTEGEEGSLKGYNSGAKRKRDKERQDALEEERRQTLEEEREAIRLSRERNPQTRQDGENIADETVNEGFWSRFR